MFMSYEVFATFGISAILSFTISVTLLLILAAKRGMLRIGARHQLGAGADAAGGGRLHNQLLLPTASLQPKIVEMTPLRDHSVYEKNIHDLDFQKVKSNI